MRRSAPLPKKSPARNRNSIASPARPIMTASRSGPTIRCRASSTAPEPVVDAVGTLVSHGRLPGAHRQLLLVAPPRRRRRFAAGGARRSRCGWCRRRGSAWYPTRSDMSGLTRSSAPGGGSGIIQSRRDHPSQVSESARSALRFVSSPSERLDGGCQDPAGSGRGTKRSMPASGPASCCKPIRR